MCVSDVRSRVVSCERVCVSCEWASRRSSVVRREAFCLRCVSCEIPKFSCRVLNSSFSFEFVVEFRISRFVAPFDFSNFVSNFEFEFVVEIFVALFDFSNFTALFDFSNFDFRVECRVQVPWIFRVEFRIRISRFVALFDFSNFVALFDFSKSIVKFDFSIRVLDSSALNFEFVFFVVLIYSTSRTLICNWWFQTCRRNCRLRAEFLVWVLNWTLQFSSKFDDYQCYCELTSSIILARSPSLRSRCHASFACAFRA